MTDDLLYWFSYILSFIWIVRKVNHAILANQMSRCILEWSSSCHIWTCNMHGKQERKTKDHEAASSSAKRTPPTGARKAPATPAAAPQVIKSLRSRSFLKCLSHFQVSRYFREPPCPRKLAMQAPVCTIGPSLPTTKPAATPKTEPKIWKVQAISILRTAVNVDQQKNGERQGDDYFYYLTNAKWRQFQN